MITWNWCSVQQRTLIGEDLIYYRAIIPDTNSALDLYLSLDGNFNGNLILQQLPNYTMTEVDYNLIDDIINESLHGHLIGNPIWIGYVSVQTRSGYRNYIIKVNPDPDFLLGTPHR